MDPFIDLDKYYPSMKTTMWKNSDLKNLISKMATISTVATNGVFTLLTRQNFSTNLKPCERYFFGTPCNILREKKSKIVRVTARSIWVGMPHKYRTIHDFF